METTLKDVIAAKDPVEVVSTGITSLDEALGVLGLPRGCLTQIVGNDAPAKERLALSLIASAQKGGRLCALIDGGLGLSLLRVQRACVELESLLIAQPESAEVTMEITETLMRTGVVDVVVIHGLPEPETEEWQVGVVARLMSQHVRKLTALASRMRVCLVFVSPQAKSPDAAPLSTALKFYTTVRIDVARRPDGTAFAKVLKNKLAAPFGEAIIAAEET